MYVCLNAAANKSSCQNKYKLVNEVGTTSVFLKTKHCFYSIAKDYFSLQVNGTLLNIRLSLNCLGRLSSHVSHAR